MSGSPGLRRVVRKLREDRDKDRAGYVLAMAVLCSDLYASADDELRAAVELFTAGVSRETMFGRARTTTDSETKS